ncbi:unnamed protein product [Linum trigynum]
MLRWGQANPVQLPTYLPQRYPSPPPAQATIPNYSGDTEENWWHAAVLFRHMGCLLLCLVDADEKKVVWTERLSCADGTGFVSLGSKLYAFGPGRSYYVCDLGGGVRRNLYKFHKAGELCSAKPYPIVIPYANSKIFIIGTGSPYELMEEVDPHLWEVLDVHANVTRPVSGKLPFYEKNARGSGGTFSRGYTVVGNTAYVSVFAYSDGTNTNPPYCLDMVTESWYPHEQKPEFNYVFNPYDNWQTLGEVCKTKLFKVELSSSSSCSERPLLCIKVLDLRISKPGGPEKVDSHGFQPLEVLNDKMNAVEYRYFKEASVLPLNNVHGDLFCLFFLYYDMKMSLTLQLYNFRLLINESPLYGCKIMSTTLYQDFAPKGCHPKLLMTSGGYMICNNGIL